MRSHDCRVVQYYIQTICQSIGWMVSHIAKTNWQFMIFCNKDSRRSKKCSHFQVCCCYYYCEGIEQVFGRLWLITTMERFQGSMMMSLFGENDAPHGGISPFDAGGDLFSMRFGTAIIESHTDEREMIERDWFEWEHTNDVIHSGRYSVCACVSVYVWVEQIMCFHFDTLVTMNEFGYLSRMAWRKPNVGKHVGAD